MKNMILLLLVASFISATAVHITESDQKAIFPIHALRDKINSNPESHWKADSYPRFDNTTVAGIKQLLGAVLPHDEGYLSPKEVRIHSLWDSPLPKFFDARDAFPECGDVIGHVRDQSNCGSCWAFAAVEAFNDRVCIEHGDHKLMSPEDTLSCCSGLSCAFSRGCDGGQPSGAWHWFTLKGVSTGGDYGDIGSGRTCKPYTILPESKDTSPTPSCITSCSETNYQIAYEDDKHFATSSYQIRGEEDIQREIMESGPISVSFSVYEDFMSYSSGVYEKTTGDLLGGHAVKMIGWGVDEGTPYWTCINSWGELWGERGIFRICRGNNECGIEDACVAGDV